jgi:hypothetical protein
MKNILIILIFVNSLYSNEILNDTYNSILKKQKQKGDIESDYTKDSWINPLYIESSITKTKIIEDISQIKSKKISINIEQEIYKSGAIWDTIAKGKNEKVLNGLHYIQERKLLLSTIYEYVIKLKKIDLYLDKLSFLILNKNMEIDKRQNLYLNGLLDINNLDESIIELSDLKNEVQDLNIEKIIILKEFKNLSNKKYQGIKLNILNSTSLEQYMNNNTSVKLKELNLKSALLDNKIINSKFLPKLSIYGSYGYKETQDIDDDYYSYGLKLTLPFDYNSNKQKNIGKLSSSITKTQLYKTKDYEKEFYQYTLNHLKFLDEKINNSNEILSKYNSIYKTIKEMYQNDLQSKEDVLTMKNRLKSIDIDINILRLDKKLVLNKIFKKIN